MSITRTATGTAASIASGSGTTITIPYAAPAGGILVNDTLVLFAWSVNTTPPTLPAGWTSLLSLTCGGLSPSMLVCYKTAAGGESGNQNVTQAGSNNAEGVMVSYRGVDSGTPIDVTGTSVTSGATGVSSLDIPTLTTTRPGVRLITAACTNNSPGTFTAPSSPAAFSELLDDSPRTPSVTVDDLSWTGVGATGTVSIVQSGTVRYAAGMVALRPAASSALNRPAVAKFRNLVIR